MRKRPVRLLDLYEIRFLRDVALSPDGRSAAFTVERMDRRENKYFTELFVVDHSGRVRAFVRGKKNLRSPQWSPDGSAIAFIQSEKEKQDLWLIPTDGGEAYRLTKADGSFGSFRWAPDGRRIVCEFTRRDVDKKRVPEKDKPPLYHHVTRAWYRLDDAGMLGRERQHLWLVNSRTGAMKQLTRGVNGDGQPAWAPDGRSVVFVTNREEDFEGRIQYEQIMAINVDGTRERTFRLPAGPKASPVLSPDGRHLAYVGSDRPDRFVGWQTYYIWLAPVKGGKAVKLTARLDRSPGDHVIDDTGNHGNAGIRFTADGLGILFLMTDHGVTGLYRFDIAAGSARRLFGSQQRVYAFDTNPSGAIVMAVSDPQCPGDVYRWHRGRADRLSWINRQYLAKRRLATVQEYRFRGAHGDEVQAWLMKPPRSSDRRRLPVCVQIHGGPYAAYGYSFFHEFQVLAARGYAVFFCNPHGSMGCGERFARALHNRWGVPDGVDIMKAVRMLKREQWADPKRFAVMGGSYGGFMTNWLIGHTNEFCAAVTMRSVVNLLSFFGHDFGFAMGREFVGDWWEKDNFRFYWNMSPLRYVTRVRTPLLIIHSEQDLRCPVGQAEELFAALKRLGRDVEMVRFPGESHELSRHGTPRRREMRLEFIVGFLKRHLG